MHNSSPHGGAMVQSAQSGGIKFCTSQSDTARAGQEFGAGHVPVGPAKYSWLQCHGEAFSEFESRRSSYCATSESCDRDLGPGGMAIYQSASEVVQDEQNARQGLEAPGNFDIRRDELHETERQYESPGLQSR
eukprot:3285990-Karenia_brevis.AAC.1